MSTRATYTFVLPYGGNVTMYIHHDGYPEGAARYLLAAHLSESRGSLADRFHRANDRAELMVGEPGDAQYAYAIHSDGTLSARKRDPGGPWAPFFAGHYAEFINRYAPEDALALAGGPLKLVKTSRFVDRREWCTRGQLERRHAAAIEVLNSYRERFPKSTGNIQYCESEVASLALALLEYDGGEVIE
ncbi:hypothetical protein ACGYQ5_14230 [Burkholderia pseudomallei]